MGQDQQTEKAAVQGLCSDTPICIQARGRNYREEKERRKKKILKKEL